MNSRELASWIKSAEGGHGPMSVYVNVNGSLVPLVDARVKIMRDEIEVPILVLEPKEVK